MKRTTKYVALDVHQATTVASVREESGRVMGAERVADRSCRDHGVRAAGASGRRLRSARGTTAGDQGRLGKTDPFSQSI